MPKPVVGAQMYTLRNFAQTIADISETLHKVREIGYTSIQISGFGPVDPAQVGKLVEDNDLTVAATHVGWNRFLGELDAVIAEHKMWNCKHAAIGGLPGEYSSPDGLKKFIDELGPVADKLGAAGMTFSYHNHSHELGRLGESTWLETLYAQAPAEMLKAEIDTYWIQHGGGDPAAWVHKYADRMPLLHLKDMCMAVAEDGKREQRFAEIGEGNLNWPAIMEAAETGCVEYLLVEQDNCYGRDPFESLAISYNNLKSMGYE
jgi:sugar phosphate isomerase/epimerase